MLIEFLSSIWFILKSLSLVELSMPCDQYELGLRNSALAAGGSPDLPVATLDQSTSTVHAVQLGHMNIVLDHKSILSRTNTPSH